MTLDTYIDWDNDGDFTDYYDNVTKDVRARTDPIRLSYGREPGGTAPTSSGTGGMTLDNASRKYSSRNTSSPIYGKIKPARPVKITRTVGGTTSTLFRGHTDETPLNPDPSSKSVAVNMVDPLAKFRGQNISTGISRGVTTGQAIGLVLDAAGWDPGLRDLDSGATVIPWWWEDGTDALTALDKLVKSEGFPAYLSVGSDGEIVFRDRFHRATRTASKTVQSTWRGLGKIEPVMGTGFTYDDAWQNIVNRASVSVDIRTPQPLEMVWSYDTPFTLSWHNVKTIAAAMPEVFIDAEVRVHWATEALGDPSNATVTLTRTSGASTIVTVDMNSVAFSTPRTFTMVEIWARTLPVTSSVSVSSEDAGSIADYGVRSFQGELPWCQEGDAQAILDDVVGARAEPLPVVTVRFVVGTNSGKITSLLPRDLSDRVRIKELETYLDNDFHIERIQHDLTGEDDHEMTFTLEHVPPNTPAEPFILGTSALGGTATLG